MNGRGVVFDLFGTLAESPSVQSYESALADMAGIVGAPWAEFRRLWMDTLADRERGCFATPLENIAHICGIMGKEIHGSLLGKAARVAEEFGRNMLALRPETVIVLRGLRRAGLKTGLVSDTAWEIPALWRASEASAFVDVAVFSCEVGLKKPEAAIYELACSRLGLRPSDCLYVGDGGSDELAGAHRAGLWAVRLRVPGEDLEAAFRPGAAEWDGPVMDSLLDVLALAEE